ncbi:hypothetical protein EOD40_15710 [Flavobacterium sufflavum]|uniref:DUF4142 domain-containing protein n=1 Tax=Flavobacterium sufflavum TaxID=1921138 RepID=A0A437KLY6_9FLAO|nr:hypothetical protein [Flavobacterium sufflavum]RVT72245.1 hypothetical protein EOD40_15710 [Flavobacterium sufflavum]
MSTIKRYKTILFFILFSISCLILTSCEKKNKDKKSIINTKVDAQVLIEIAESNLKVVAITQKAREREMENSTRTVFQKIESDHIELKNKIKKIAKDNFIIIPSTLYDTKPLKLFISEANTYLYLKKTTDLLLAELEYYKNIAITTQNIALKVLATESITNIQNNISVIQKELKTQG